jgi:prevent-host-death family protein
LNDRNAAAMQTFSANEAKTRFGEFMDQVQKGPVRVTRHDRVVSVMVSSEDYDAMRAFYANRLQHTLVQTAERAAAQGLTEEVLALLLADKS